MYDLLFNPIELPGGLKLRNRILLPAMHMNLAPTGYVTDLLVDFYRLRARGGAGLIIVGGCPVNKDAGGEFMIGINDDSFVEGLTRLTAAMRGEGAASAVQLYHAGRYTYSMLIGGAAAPSASETISPLTKERSRALNVEEIEHTLQDFSDAARRAAAAGFDAVELLASAGYLVSQFLSPLTNHRTDDYGGSLRNRMRFGLEVLAAMKEGSGGLPVVVRFGGNDFVNGGTPRQEILAFARALAEHGAALFNVTGGWHETNVPQITYHVPVGGMAHLAAAVKQTVGDLAPVSASNRLHHPEEAERVLRHGVADMVSLGRPLITDPFWLEKARAGKADQILTCISCNQACLDRVFELRQVGCAVNPLACEADEETFPQKRSEAPKRMLIVGGGPAGLTAARLLAGLGHAVSLYDDGPAPGGQVRVCAKSPHKESFAAMAPSMAALAQAAGAELHFGVTVDADVLTREHPDVVVVAAGARPALPRIPGLELPHVMTSHSFIADDLPAGPHVVVVGGGPSGLEAALKAALRGTLSPETVSFSLLFDSCRPEEIRQLMTRGHNKVTVVEMKRKVGDGVGRSTKWVYRLLLETHGIEVLTSTTVKSIRPGVVVVEQAGEEKTLPADSVIIAAGVASNKDVGELALALDKPPAVEYIGDAGRPGDIETATASALTLARRYC